MKKLKRAFSGSLGSLKAAFGDDKPPEPKAESQNEQNSSDSENSVAPRVSPKLSGSYVRFSSTSLEATLPPTPPYSSPFKGDPLFTKLHKWSLEGDITKMGKLMKKIDVNTPDSRGRSPCHLCAFRGHGAPLALLLSGGADPNAKDKDGATPLFRAIQGAKVRATQVLLQHKADPHIRTILGETILHAAVSGGSKPLFGLILDVGVNTEVQDSAGTLPIHAAAAKLEIDFVKLLLDHGANPNGLTKENVSPLMISAKYGCKTLVQMLLEAGANPNLVDNSDWTAASYARYCDNIEIQELLEGFMVKQATIERPQVRMIGLGDNWTPEDEGSARSPSIDDWSDDTWKNETSAGSEVKRPKLTHFISSDDSMTPSKDVPPKPPRSYNSTPDLSEHNEFEKPVYTISASEEQIATIDIHNIESDSKQSSQQDLEEKSVRDELVSQDQELKEASLSSSLSFGEDTSLPLMKTSDSINNDELYAVYYRHDDETLLNKNDAFEQENLNEKVEQTKNLTIEKDQFLETETSSHGGTFGRIGTLHSVEEMWEANASLNLSQSIHAKQSSQSSTPTNSPKIQSPVLQKQFFGDSKENMQNYEINTNEICLSPTSSRSTPVPAVRKKVSFIKQNSLESDIDISELSSESGTTDKLCQIDNEHISPTAFQELKVKLKQEYDKRKNTKSKINKSIEAKKKLEEKLNQLELLSSQYYSDASALQNEKDKLEYEILRAKDEYQCSQLALEETENQLYCMETNASSLRQELVSKEFMVKTLKEDLEEQSKMASVWKAMVEAIPETDREEKSVQTTLNWDNKEALQLDDKTVQTEIGIEPDTYSSLGITPSENFEKNNLVGTNINLEKLISTNTTSTQTNDSGFVRTDLMKMETRFSQTDSLSTLGEVSPIPIERILSPVRTDHKTTQTLDTVLGTNASNLNVVLNEMSNTIMDSLQKWQQTGTHIKEDINSHKQIVQLNEKRMQEDFTRLQEIVLSTKDSLNKDQIREIENIIKQSFKGLQTQIEVLKSMSDQVEDLNRLNTDLSLHTNESISILRQNSEMIENIGYSVNTLPAKISDVVSMGLDELGHRRDCNESEIGLVGLESSLKKTVQNLETNSNHLEEMRDCLNDLTIKINSREDSINNMINIGKKSQREHLDEVTLILDQTLRDNEKNIYGNLKTTLKNIDETVGENFEILQNLMGNFKSEIISKVNEMITQTNDADRDFRFNSLTSELEQINGSLSSLKSFIESYGAEPSSKSLFDANLLEAIRGGNDQALNSIQNQSRSILKMVESCETLLRKSVEVNNTTHKDNITEKELQQKYNFEKEIENLRNQNLALKETSVEEKKNVEIEREKRINIEVALRSMSTENKALKETNIALSQNSENFRSKYEHIMYRNLEHIERDGKIRSNHVENALRQRNLSDLQDVPCKLSENKNVDKIEKPNSFSSIEQDLSQKVDCLTEDKNKLEIDLKSKSKLIKQLSFRVKDLENDRKDLEINLNLKENQIYTLKKDVESFKNRIQTQTSHIDVLDMKNKHENLIQELSQKQNLILNLRERLSALSQEKVAMQKELSNLKKDKATTEVLAEEKQQAEYALKRVQLEFQQMKDNFSEDYVPKSKLNSLYEEIESFFAIVLSKRLAECKQSMMDKVVSLERANSILKEKENTAKIEQRSMQEQIHILTSKVNLTEMNLHLWKSKYEQLFDQHFNTSISETPNPPCLTPKNPVELPFRSFEESSFVKSALKHVTSDFGHQYTSSGTPITQKVDDKYQNQSKLSQSYTHQNLTKNKKLMSGIQLMFL